MEVRKWLKNWHVPQHEGRNELPPSLNEAIDAFIIACALRRLRGQEADHCSMLVHVTRYPSVQKIVHFQIEERVRHLRQRLQRRAGHEEVVARLRSLWERDFAPTARIMAEDPDCAASTSLGRNRAAACGRRG
jgi:Z1 domain